MAANSLYYRYSGRFGMSGAALTLVAALAVAAIGGGVYGIICYYSPIIYVNVLLTFAIGAAVGWCAARTAIAMHVRNPAMVILIGCAGAVVADYVGFVTWLLPITDWQVVVINPLELAQVLQLVAAQGVWGLSKSAPVSGIALYAVWLAELGLMVGTAFFVARTQITNMPYCEHCGQWMRLRLSLLPFERITDEKALRASLEQGDFKAIGQLAYQHGHVTNYAKIDLVKCPTCDELTLIDVVNIRIDTDKKGKQAEHTSHIVRNLLIDPETYQLLVELLSRGPAPVPEAPADDSHAM